MQSKPKIKKVKFSDAINQFIYEKEIITKQQKKRIVENYLQARLVQKNFSIFVFNIVYNNIHLCGCKNPFLKSFTFNVNKLLAGYYHNLSIEFNKINKKPQYLIEKITEKTFVKYKIFPIKPASFIQMSIKDTLKGNISPVISLYFSNKFGKEYNYDPQEKIDFITLNTDYTIPITNDSITMVHDNTLFIDNYTGVFYELI